MKGHNSDLYILAFDHRGTLTKGLLGVEGREPSVEEEKKVQEMKSIIFDGFKTALDKGESKENCAILVDERFGLAVQKEAKELGIRFAAPVEKSGQKIFDFEYGENFGEKIHDIGADFIKVLDRWNPDDDRESRETQGERIRKLSEWIDEIHQLVGNSVEKNTLILEIKNYALPHSPSAKRSLAIIWNFPPF